MYISYSLFKQQCQTLIISLEVLYLFKLRHKVKYTFSVNKLRRLSYVGSLNKKYCTGLIHRFLPPTPRE